MESPGVPPETAELPNFFDTDESSRREQYRRYKKRQSPAASPLLGSAGSKFSHGTHLFDTNSAQRRPNTSLLLEEIKQEVDYFNTDEYEGSKNFSSTKRRGSIGTQFDEPMSGSNFVRQRTKHSLKSVKREYEELPDEGTTFTLFASLLESALQGLMTFPDVILQFEQTCRKFSESIRYGDVGRHGVVEDKFMQQKASLLLDEAASWSLLWYMYGKGTEDLPGDILLIPSTSHQVACKFVKENFNAQVCLRIVLWLQGLASESLDLEEKVRGSHVGSYLPSSGVWHHTQRLLKRKSGDASLIRHMDFDAPTREGRRLLPEDKKQEELLMEDVWILLRAGRLEEASMLCLSAGQAWRAATLCPFGGVDLFPSVEVMIKNGKTRKLQSLEQESGIGRQLRLWKWASYCASEKIAEQDGGRYEMAVYALQCSNLKHLLPVCKDWESACWAIAKSWLDTQVDLELVQFQPRKLENRQYEDDDMNGASSEGRNELDPDGPESWPYQVLDQQPRDIASFFQKLHSSDFVHEAVSRACREQHRQIEMSLISGHLDQVVDLLWLWVSPTEDDYEFARPHGDPEMMRFAAHLVILLRNIVDEIGDTLGNKLLTVGDLILNVYAMFLFSKQQEDLVGLYASQLAHHRCIDLFVEMMEQRLNSSMLSKYNLFLSAVEHLPYSSEDHSKASVEKIIERLLSRSRETKSNNYDGESSNVTEMPHSLTLDKAMVVQWLCFTSPSTIADFERTGAKLLLRALNHSNTLFREFALVSMRRVPDLPAGPHKLLSFLAEPLQHKEMLLSINDTVVADNLKEFDDWREYYCLDATYRNWRKVEDENAAVPPDTLSHEEKDRAISTAKETLNLAFSLLRDDAWLGATQGISYEIPSSDVIYLELRATAILCLPSGGCLLPDATMCTALSSALYSTVSEEDVLNRQLRVDVNVSIKDPYCIEVALRCLAIEGDGIGAHNTSDGGILAAIISAGFKGELKRFQLGITMEISRLDAWYSDIDGSVGLPANYIVGGLCRRCCLPEIILRCMEVLASLARAGESIESIDRLIELVGSRDSGMLHLFSQHQLQEFLRLVRECVLQKMELEEE